MPEASIASFFIKDMKGYTRTFPEDQFLPRGAINVAVIIVRVIFISSFFFYCLLLNHSFPTNPNMYILTSFKLILFYN